MKVKFVICVKLRGLILVLMCLGNVKVWVIGVCIFGLFICVSIELFWYCIIEWIIFCGCIIILILFVW